MPREGISLSGRPLSVYERGLQTDAGTHARNGLCVAGVVLTLVAFSPGFMSAASVDQWQQGVRGLSMMSSPDDVSAVGNLRQHLAGAIPDARFHNLLF